MIIGHRRALNANTPFMKLPTEIRLEIGKLVLGSHQYNMSLSHEESYGYEKISWTDVKYCWRGYFLSCRLALSYAVSFALYDLSPVTSKAGLYIIRSYCGNCSPSNVLIGRKLAYTSACPRSACQATQRIRTGTCQTRPQQLQEHSSLWSSVICRSIPPCTFSQSTPSEH